MKTVFVIAVLLLSSLCLAANEERFRWNSIEFCATRVDGWVQNFADYDWDAEFEVLRIVHSGHFLGASYDEFYFHVRPDQIITGVTIIVGSTDFSAMKSKIDSLANERWGDSFASGGSNGSFFWTAHSEDRDVSMYLRSSATSPFKDIGYGATESLQVRFSSASECDRATELPEVSEIEMSREEVEHILEVMPDSMHPAPTELLLGAIDTGKIESAKVLRQLVKFPPEIAELEGIESAMSEHVQVIFSPIEVSSTRVFKGRVLCFKTENALGYNHCQDESWIRLKIEWMPRPIRFSGELTDEDVRAIYGLIDDLGLVSRTDNERVTSDKIYQILKYPHAGNRINIYVTTERRGYTDVIYLRRSVFDAEEPAFELSEFRCGVDDH